ncbi:hypothetical protein PMAYCL1PPCAC_20612 [Pristionchus mayeri]|uniref:Uncharacterized protein n=1 Tax=Pristionchus mayeri TaxID=1317129 RepID=A0AAN5CTR6_9BILA|nr:hypothetical protein PMAYCL1PPCAC_20612 [Pristionchus mayeri]
MCQHISLRVHECCSKLLIVFSYHFINNGRSVRQLLQSYHPSHRSVDGQGMRRRALPQHPPHLPRILPWSDSRLLYHQRQSPSPPLTALLKLFSLLLLPFFGL